MKPLFPVLTALFISAADTAAAFDWSAEVYGGLALERSETFDSIVTIDVNLNQGTVLGFGVYAEGVVPGLNLGADVMWTRAAFSGSGGLASIETLSLMAVLRKGFRIGQTVEGYVSGGAGVLRATYIELGGGISDTVFGAQVALGLQQSLGANTKIFGEIKYQAALKDPTYGTYSQSNVSTNILMGLQFGF